MIATNIKIIVTNDITYTHTGFNFCVGVTDLKVSQ